MQDKDIALALSLEPDIRCVRAGTRFGQREAGYLATTANLRDDVGRHFARTMLRNNPGVECVQQQDITNIHILTRQLLYDDAFGHVILTEAADFFGKRGANQSEFAHLVN